MDQWDSTSSSEVAVREVSAKVRERGGHRHDCARGRPKRAGDSRTGVCGAGGKERAAGASVRRRARNQLPPDGAGGHTKGRTGSLPDAANPTVAVQPDLLSSRKFA